MAKVQNFLIYTGYVESESTGCLAFYHEHGFETVEQALKHMAKCFLTGFQMERENAYWKECCEQAREDGHKHCPKCGAKIEKFELNIEELGFSIMDYQRGDHDGTPYEVWEVLNVNGWWAIGDTRLDKFNDINNVVIIIDRGDEILANLALTDSSLEQIVQETFAHVTVSDNLKLYNT